MSPSDAPRLVYVLAHPLSADRLVRGQLGYMRSQGFEVILIVSPGAAVERVRAREGIEVITLPMERSIRPWRDLATLLRLTRTLHRLRPDVVNAGTTKAGLLGMIAATLVGVPGRVYVVRGLRLETLHGLRRHVLAITEHIASRCSNRIIVNSESLRRRYHAMGFAPAWKTKVLGEGSGNGVDIGAYRPGEARRAEAARLRVDLGIGPDDNVVGFVGRLARDKGPDDLLQAFDGCRRENDWLLVVGDLDPDDMVSPETEARYRKHPRVRITGHVADPAPYYALLDVLIFPSLREGFPNVVLEAACAEVPTVGYAATGTVDAVVHGETGLLVEVGDIAALRESLARYLNSPALRAAHGKAAARRAEESFSQERVWQALEDVYRDVLEASGWQK